MWNDHELLKTVQLSEKITSYVDLRKRLYRRPLNFPGIYCFWLRNSDKTARNLKRDVVVHGPERLEQRISWDWNLDEDLICLYVGKSTNVQHRLGLHLLLKTLNLYEVSMNSLNKKTTSCQLRSGFDYLYQDQKNPDILEIMSERLLFSCFREDSFVKRFYMEDYLVGKLLPWFNVDSER